MATEAAFTRSRYCNDREWNSGHLTTTQTTQGGRLVGATPSRALLQLADTGLLNPSRRLLFGIASRPRPFRG
jgi:hypothetical protein